VHDATRAARGSSGRGAIKLGALLAVLVALLGCGQRGPLTLPDSARAIERLDPGAQPAGAAPATPPTEPETEDDGSPNEARPPENER
jgi:predicted small lipoprotein YifL